MTDKEEIKNLKNRIVKANKRIAKERDRVDRELLKIKNEAHSTFSMSFNLWKEYSKNTHPHPRPKLY